MVTATLTTAGVTLAARSEKSCGVASPAMAVGAVNIGTISAGAVSAVVSARAAKMRDFCLGHFERASSLLAGGIWDPAHGAPMAATLNVCIVGPVKILLIEDDRQTADYIAKGLREHGHVVDKADNGRDGLYLATGETYDVMIVDRNLPKMDGLSLVKAARASGTQDAGAVPDHDGRRRRPRRRPRGRRRRLSGQALRLRRAAGAGRRAGPPAADRGDDGAAASATSRSTCWRAP